MSRLQYKFKYDEYGSTREIVVYGSGNAVSSISFVNKGTAFNATERTALGLEASLPPSIRDLDDQIQNTQRIVSSKVDDIERFIFIRSLFDRNATLAHALISSDLEKYTGIVYTPTIGMAVRKYSSLYRQANGLHFYPGNIDMAEDILRRYLHRDIRVAVVTDNQGIPGIGDQGVGGIAVCLGKLMLYTQGGGIAPWHCLPISLDVGTDNERLLADNQYLGWRNRRLEGEEYLSFVGRFVRAFKNVFPDTLCQWENFSRPNGFGIRDAFADEVISFNDNIQGTGAVALAAIFSAMRAKNERITDQKFMVFGDDSGCVGVCEQLEATLIESGLSATQARDAIFLVDQNGLVVEDNVSEYYLRKYAKDLSKYPDLAQGMSVHELVRKTGSTIIVSTTSQGACLDEQTVHAMLANCDKPVIIPLFSAVERNRDCIANILKWSKGRALVASGSPLNSISLDGHECKVSQGNNILVFPGVGLGSLVSGAREIKPQFFTVAAKAISDMVSQQELDEGQLLPRIRDLEKVSNKVALAVAMCAVENGVSRPCIYSSFQHENDESRMRELIKKIRWEPTYLPLTPM